MAETEGTPIMYEYRTVLYRLLLFRPQRAGVEPW